MNRIINIIIFFNYLIGVYFCFDDNNEKQFDNVLLKLENNHIIELVFSDNFNNKLLLKIDFFCDDIIIFSNSEYLLQSSKTSNQLINSDNVSYIKDEESFHIGKYLINIPYKIDYNNEYYNHIQSSDLIKSSIFVNGYFCISKNSRIINYWNQLTINPNFILFGAFNMATNRYDLDYLNILKFDAIYNINNDENNNNNIYKTKSLEANFEDFILVDDKKYSIIIDLNVNCLYLPPYLFNSNELSFKQFNSDYFYDLKNSGILKSSSSSSSKIKQIKKNNNLNFKVPQIYGSQGQTFNFEKNIEEYITKNNTSLLNLKTKNNNNHMMVVLGKNVLEEFNLYLNFENELIIIEDTIKFEEIDIITSLIQLLIFLCFSLWVIMLINVVESLDSFNANVIKKQRLIKDKKLLVYTAIKQKRDETKTSLNFIIENIIIFKFFFIFELFLDFIVFLFYFVLKYYYDTFKFASICINFSEDTVFLILISDLVITVLMKYSYLIYRTYLVIKYFENSDDDNNNNNKNKKGKKDLEKRILLFTSNDKRKYMKRKIGLNNLYLYYPGKIYFRIFMSGSVVIPFIYILIIAEHKINFNDLIGVFYLLFLQVMSIIVYTRKTTISIFSNYKKEKHVKFLKVYKKVIIFYKVAFNSSIFTTFVINSHFDGHLCIDDNFCFGGTLLNLIFILTVLNFSMFLLYIKNKIK